MMNDEPAASLWEVWRNNWAPWEVPHGLGSMARWPYQDNFSGDGHCCRDGQCQACEEAV